MTPDRDSVPNEPLASVERDELKVEGVLDLARLILDPTHGEVASKDLKRLAEALLEVHEALNARKHLRHSDYNRAEWAEAKLAACEERLREAQIVPEA